MISLIMMVSGSHFPHCCQGEPACYFVREEKKIRLELNLTCCLILFFAPNSNSRVSQLWFSLTSWVCFVNAALKCQSESMEPNSYSATSRCQIKSENNEATFLSSQEIVSPVWCKWSSWHVTFCSGSDRTPPSTNLSINELKCHIICKQQSNPFLNCVRV